MSSEGAALLLRCIDTDQITSRCIVHTGSGGAENSRCRFVTHRQCESLASRF